MAINPGGGWGCRSRGRLHTMHGTASGSETHRRQAREGQAETVRWAGPRTLGSRRSRYRATRVVTDDQVPCLFIRYSTRDGATACLCACRDRVRSGNSGWMIRAPRDPSTPHQTCTRASRVSSEDQGAFCLCCRVSAQGRFLVCAYKWEFLIGTGMPRLRLAEPRASHISAPAR